MIDDQVTEPVKLTRRILAHLPRAVVESWASVFSVALTEEQKNGLVYQLEALSEQAQQEEREECAKIAEAWSLEIPDQETFDGDGIYTTVDGGEVADLIRARSTPKTDIAKA